MRIPLRIAGASRIGEIERFPGCSPTGRADRRIGRNRQLTAAERLRCARRIGVLGWVEGIAAAPARLGRDRRLRGFLDDRRGSGDLRLFIARLRLPIGRLSLLSRTIGRIGRLRGRSGRILRDRRRSGHGLRAALKLPQPLFELAVAVLQFLVLARQLPQLIFQPLDTHFRIGVIGLRKHLGTQREQRGDGRGTGHMNETR